MVALLDPSQPHRRRFFLAWTLVFWLAIYASSIFTPALLDDADSVHAEAAKEILKTHDWVTLHIDGGIRYLEKAPLMYWAVAASYKLFGISEWSTRLPLALGVLALLLATYSFGRRVFGAEGGFYSALVLVTAFGPYVFTRFLIPDILVGLWLTLGFDFFLRTLEEEQPSRAACWGLAVTAALNVLTKGLIGLVFPVATIFLFLVLTGGRCRLLRLRVVSSLLVFLAVAAPWHALAALRNPPSGEARGFLWFYFVNEHFLRYLNKRYPPDYDTVPLALFWGLMLVWLLPWSAFLVQGLAQGARSARERLAGGDARRRANLLCLVWALVVLVFFSFSSRQEYYVIPALPALALLVGGWLAREASAETESTERRTGRRSATVLLVLGAVALIAAVFLAASSRKPPPGADISDLLRQNPEQYALSFGHFFDLTPEALGAFRVPLVGTGIALFAGGLAAWLFRRRGRPGLANLGLAISMVLLLLCVHRALVLYEPVLSSKALAEAVKKEYRPGEILVIDGQYEEGSTLNFYVDAPVRLLSPVQSNMWYGTRFADAPKVFEDEASLAEKWREAGRIYLWTDEAREPSILAVLRGTPVYVLAHKGGRMILTNQPAAGAAQVGR